MIRGLFDPWVGFGRAPSVNVLVTLPALPGLSGFISFLIDTGADTIVLGCMSMGFMDVDGMLSDELGVPVVNPVRAALAFAEGLVRQGLKQSRAAYALPPKMAKGLTLEQLLLG